VRSEWLDKLSRLVVKVGTGALTDDRNQPDAAQRAQLVAQLAAQRAAGREVVLVTSGAVGTGMGVLGYTARPPSLSQKQACAAVGNRASWLPTTNCSRSTALSWRRFC
jgi:glutamate 5-kinase